MNMLEIGCGLAHHKAMCEAIDTALLMSLFLLELKIIFENFMMKLFKRSGRSSKIYLLKMNCKLIRQNLLLTTQYLCC